MEVSNILQTPIAPYYRRTIRPFRTFDVLAEATVIASIINIDTVGNYFYFESGSSRGPPAIGSLAAKGFRCAARVAGTEGLGVCRRYGRGVANDALRLAPIHHLGPAIVAVAADGDAGCRPMAADRPDETADMTAHLGAGGRLARPQDHGHGTAGRRVVDVDRQKAALVVVGIEERQLLVP